MAKSNLSGADLNLAWPGSTKVGTTMGESLADSLRAPSVRELRNVSRPVLDAEGKVVPPERHAGLGPACPTAWRL